MKKNVKALILSLLATLAVGSLTACDFLGGKTSSSTDITSESNDNSSVGEVENSTTSEEDEEMIKELQRNAAFRNPNMAAAHLVGAQAEAMKAAASNPNAGAAMAFMGMNLAGNAGGANAQTLFQMGQQMQPAPQAAPAQPVAAEWKCSCGSVNTGKFCPECGSPREWKCTCGSVNTGKFCPECGAKKPE